MMSEGKRKENEETSRDRKKTKEEERTKCPSLSREEETGIKSLDGQERDWSRREIEGKATLEMKSHR